MRNMARPRMRVQWAQNQAFAGSGQATRRRHIHQRPGLSRDRHPHGRLPGPHPAGSLDGRAARPLELVAIQPRQTRRSHRRTGTRTHTLPLATSLGRDGGVASSRPRTARPQVPTAVASYAGPILEQRDRSVRRWPPQARRTGVFRAALTASLKTPVMRVERRLHVLLQH